MKSKLGKILKDLGAPRESIYDGRLTANPNRVRKKQIASAALHLHHQPAQGTSKRPNRDRKS